MNTVLYEADFHFSSSLLVVLIIPVAFLLWPWIQEKYSALAGRGIMLLPKRACITFGCIVAASALIALLFQGHMYVKTVGAYHNGQFEEIEGYVENFVPMPYDGHARESFEIDGVYFEYSDYNVVPGYHNTKSHGGVITHNGQHLKIRYVYYNTTYGNIIVHIEELAP
ncbi:MAG: hypothetical protein IJX69_02095 [Oscillospiraceae bacterium]|nr:hypothetical protein [Oscillospiraceae bacterium]